MRTFERTDDLGGFLAFQLAANSTRHRWSIDAPSADRTPILYQVADAIAASDCGIFPLVVQPPKQDFDTGAVGLAQIVAGVARIDGDRALVERIADPELAWAEKRMAVRSRLSEFGDQVVLITDEPDRWSPTLGDRRLFSRRAEDVAALLTHEGAWSTIVAGHDRLASERIRLRPGDAAAVLVDGSRDWNTLSETAGLLHRELADGLGGFSKAEVCLLVALLRFTSIEDIRRLISTFPAAVTLAQILARTIRRYPERKGLLNVWTSISLARGPFDPILVEEIFTDAFSLEARLADPMADDLIRCCLLQPVDARVEMPTFLRATATELLPRSAIDAHATFARHYARKAAGARDGQMLVDEMEAYHHAALSEDPGIIVGLRPFFSDQLDAWGRSLSQRQRYAQAVEVFERAIAWDPDDDYAHHYAAFNLDVEGREAVRVDEHYTTAIELDPDNVWWRSRFICFLIARGRVSDARRAWSDALRDLASREKPFLFEHLHIWVARLLLHRMRLDFARDVLDSIPERFRAEIPRVAALDRHLLHLEAADRGRTIRPFRRPLDTRPDDHPERAALRDEAHQPLVRWLSGRIEDIERDAIHIAVGTPGQSAGEIQIRRASMPRADFDRFSLDESSDRVEPGRFVEFAYYGDSKIPTIRVLHRREPMDPDLPPLGFDPDRYLRHARRRSE